MTTQTASALFDACEYLFEKYPLAITPHLSEDPAETAHWREMTLVTPEPDPAFWILTHTVDPGDAEAPYYDVRSWKKHTPGVTTLYPDRAQNLTPAVTRALTWGVPLPVDGSLFGWLDATRAASEADPRVTAIIQIQAGPDNTVPTFATMPLAESPAPSWDGALQPLFGSWFWDDYRMGQIVDLAPVIDGTLDRVFWIDAQDTLGSGLIGVTSDLPRTRDSWVLPQGVYAHYPLLQAGTVIPPLKDLLEYPRVFDLGDRFSR